MLLAVGRSEPAQELRRGIHFAVSPIQAALAGGTRSVTQVLGAFAEIDQLRQENRTLRSQVEGLTQQVEQLGALEQENARLTKALDTRRSLARSHETMLASVIGREATQFESAITLDRASDAGHRARRRRPLRRRRARRVDRRGGTDLQLRAAHQRLALPRGGGGTSKTRATGIDQRPAAALLEMTEIRITDATEVGHAVITAGINQGRASSPCSRRASSSARSSTSARTRVGRPDRLRGARR